MTIYTPLSKFIKPGASLALGVLLLMLFVGCSNDKFDEDLSTKSPDSTPLYVSLTVKTPATRSTRDDNDKGYTEENGNSHLESVTGTENETRLHSAVIFFVDEEGEVCLKLDADDDIIGPYKGITNITAEIEDISKLTALKGKTLELYVVGNEYQTSLNHTLSDKSENGKTNKPEDAKFSIDSYGAPIGRFNHGGNIMPLVNASAGPVITIPNTEGDELVKYIISKFDRHGKDALYWDINNKDNALDLERAVARFEYHDLLTRETLNEGGDMAGVAAAESKNLPKNQFYIEGMGIILELAGLKPFNVSKEAYLFRHTAEGSLEKATGSAGIFGIENGGNNRYTWVANPDWGTLANGAYSLNETRASTFLNELKITETAYEIGPGSDWIDISTIEGNSNEQDDYHPFAYVMENTLPSVDLMEEYEETQGTNGVEKNYIVTKYATGVAFKFKVMDNKGKAFTKETSAEDTPAQYTWDTENVDDLIITDPATTKWVKVNQESDGCYYLTYIAVVVHNDSDNKAAGKEYAPMYYGVVRNNTYQISVKSIKFLPLPREPQTVFVTIDCRVAPWDTRWDDDVTLY